MMSGESYNVEYFGVEQQPVVIIDDFSSDMASLIVKAKSEHFEPKGPFYPGIRAKADPAYLAERNDLLTSIIRTVFGIQTGASVLECSYSLVTTKPKDLMPIQCLPHFDGLETGRLALLHYLCNSDKGGTAFYRHKNTGFETVTAERFERYKAALNAEVKSTALPPKRYFIGDSDQFEMIGKVEAKPNRLIIYRSILLHSGFIPDGFDFEVDPEKGRLTLNTFFLENR